MIGAQRFSQPFTFKDLGISLVVHILVLICALIFNYRSHDIDKDKKNIKLKLIKKKKLIDSALRIDVVAMPRLTVKELRKLKIPAAAPAKKAPVAPLKKKKAIKKVVKDKPGKSKSDFQNLLKNLSNKKIDLKNVKKKKKTIVKTKKETPKLSAEVKKQLAALSDLALEGNKISKGNQVLSDKISLKEQKISLEQYAQKMIARVKPNWRLPSYLLKEKISCQIRVYISENGDLINISLHKSSGNKEFDSRALSAVEKSAPFEIPGLSIRSRLVAGEILLGFPL